MTRTPRTHLALYSAALAILPFALSPSCGRAPRPTGPTPTVTPPSAATFIDASKVRGGWQWSHAHEADGVRRVENERWTLELDGTALSGRYTREVSFLSLDGAPFDCSQTLSYSLRSTFQLSGTAHSKHVELREVDFDTADSPCEGGFRKLASYEGFLTDEGLMLIWKGGSQTLTRAAVPQPAPEAPMLATDGRWEWQNSSDEEAAGEVRVEREDWELSEGPEGVITGTYLRAVTVYDPEGKAFACSGQSQYRYTDRYTVRGTRKHSRVLLSEVAVDPEPHPCLAQKERHLDAAVGTVEGGFIELTWRGGHRQVLHRPPPIETPVQTPPTAQR